MLKLKKYQEDALNVLENFLRESRTKPVEDAFALALRDQGRSQRYQPVFGEAPSVCIRVPTGGGKTLLGVHAVSIAGKAVADNDAPVVLWLTPSDAIRAQTLEGLSDARHPYRQALGEHFGDRIIVCDLESLQTVGAKDVGRACILVVATIQAFNVSDTATRNIYSFSEELAPHFYGLAPNEIATLEKVTSEDLPNHPYLTQADVGRVKFSVANWLSRQRPVVIVDEAHNARTDRFFVSLGRLNPSCVIELTATPVSGNNVLYQVSAAELKAEQMIKLPIALAEHPDGWEACLRDAVLTRTNLETLAQSERDYVRPIALIQAEPKNGTATVEVVRNHLLDVLNIPTDQVKVATGSQKELDGVDLFDPTCAVRYVITVEALKEGWDCSFAYVLASLQSIRSAKDVEQLLGRVLRMPYAASRENDALNKAYAHIVASDFAEAAANLKDRMVQNMGFEPLEVSGILLPLQQPLTLSGGLAGVAQLPDLHVDLSQVPETANWPDQVKHVVEVRPTSQGATILLKGSVDAETLSQVEIFVCQSVAAKHREAVKQQFDAHRALRRSLMAPAQLGVSFAVVPQLCLDLDGNIEVVERETLSGLGQWNLSEGPVQLEGFAIHEAVNSFEIDVNGERVKYKHVDSQQLNLNSIGTTVTEQDLVRWLDVDTRQPFIPQTQLRAYLVKMVSYLTRERGFTLTALVRSRHFLAHAIRAEIHRLRQSAMAKGFQSRLSDMFFPEQGRAAQFCYQPHPGQYPARNTYQGSYEFSKHYYPVIHDLREKTQSGKRGEEFLCAQALDANPRVKSWIRNIERQEKYSFWLPTATDYFYPDFLAELVDGRVLVVEYKGDAYATNDDSREKKQVGFQWEKASGGRCLFLFAVADDNGRSVSKQIADKIAL